LLLVTSQVADKVAMQSPQTGNSPVETTRI